MRNVSAAVNLVLDVRASKVNSSVFTGKKRRAIFQRQLKKDICHLLQCPDEQVVCVDIARHNTGEPGCGGVDELWVYLCQDRAAASHEEGWRGWLC